MSRPKKQEIQELNAYFLPETFVIDEVENQSVGSLKTWIEAFEEDKYRALFHLGFLKKENWFSPSIEYLHHMAEMLIKKLSQEPEIEINRDTVKVDLLEGELYHLKEELPFVIGMEYVDDVWLRTLWERLLAVFRLEIKNYEGTVAGYFAGYNSDINVAGRVFFHLVENKEEEYPFAFMATYSTKPVKSKKTIHTPLKNALEEFDGDEKKLLSLISTVIKAAEKSRFISELIESGELFSPLKLTAEEAHIILSEMTTYEEAGILCRVPDWWRKNNNSLRLSVTVGEKVPSKVGLEAIMDFSPSLFIGDEVISEEELRAFLDMAEGLIQYKGKWVEINKIKMEAVLEAFEKAKEFSGEDGLSLGEAMRLELNMNKLLDVAIDEVDVSISNGQWFRTMKESLIHPEIIQKVGIEPTFHATLRAYQENGYHWLTTMSHLGFGACLADDMGLGKTVQMIAFLEHQRV
ncbi:MAG: ATP-dependent helicase, partial [Eubacteriaceae bacterium]|nr:ATP-dependent helicase [Eubacteriaceae bacterium]